LIVVFDASAFISAVLKADSVPERALLRAMIEPNHLILSQEVEDEYREVLFRRKFDRFVSAERRKLILDTVIFAADRVEPHETIRECHDPKDDKYLAPLAGHFNTVSRRLAGADLTATCCRTTASRN
jgi:putative PIN family toxin of toxin-antitoxin system